MHDMPSTCFIKIPEGAGDAMTFHEAILCITSSYRARITEKVMGTKVASKPGGMSTRGPSTLYFDQKRNADII